MSTSDAYTWDPTVPGGDAELAAELRRHGIGAGHWLHVAVAAEGNERSRGEGIEIPSFFSSFDGPADLAQRSDGILQAEFPNGR